MLDLLSVPDFSRLLSHLSDEQRAAVLSTARITVVPACPGSGKTRVFAARFAWESGRHRTGNGGIAALSFTRVAEREIRERLAIGGIIGGHPHFVGTIDKFLIHYVIRVFASEWVNLRYFERPFAFEERLIQLADVPGSPRGNPLSEHRLSREGGQTTCDLRKEVVTDKDRIGTILKAKKTAWQLGHLTHDDVCFISACLLENAKVRAVLLKRFPILLIDEFQDTGASRASAMLSLLDDPTLSRALVVGDPDQCIMEFTGASPRLFANAGNIQGAELKYLPTTHRFHQGIVDVVNPFAKELGELRAYSDVSFRSRSTILLTHTLGAQAREISSVPKAVQKFHSGEFEGSPDSVALLAWSGSVVARLKGIRRRSNPDFGCLWLETLFTGLKRWQQDDALGLFRCVAQIMMEAGEFEGTSEPTRRDLQERGLDLRDWKRMVWRMALNVVVPASENETIGEWIWRLKSKMHAEFVRCGIDAGLVPHRIKLQKSRLKELATRPLSVFLDEICDIPVTGMLVEKVHQVKGKEFDLVCFFVPTPKSEDAPVQKAWFGPVGTEESRIAYVAMTRAKKALMVVIPKSWEDDLSLFPQGRQFLEAFSYRGSLDGYLSQSTIAVESIVGSGTLDLFSLMPPTSAEL